MIFFILETVKPSLKRKQQWLSYSILASNLNQEIMLLSLDKIQEAHDRLQAVLQPTSFHLNFNLSKKFGCKVYLKREDLQIVRSFKIRGAYNKIASMDSHQTARGIVCASAGNHAQGVAFACSQLKIEGTIFMPTTTPKQKIAKVKLFGNEYVKIVLIGDTFDDAQSEALTLSQNEGLPFIHPFDDDEVMEGQGTVALEMIGDKNPNLDLLIVAVGGGGLISGVGSVFKQLSPHTKIIGVESEGAPALFKSFNENKIVKLNDIDSFADGIAVKSIGNLTYEICKQVVDDIILVPEGKICSTLLSLYNDEGIVVEPAGAIGIAALDLIPKHKLANKNVGIIVCGGNNDIARTEEIRERALLYEGKKHYLIVRFPQRAGALRDFLNVLGPDDDITHFEYTKKNNRDSGPALVGIELKNKDELQPLLDRMKAKKINYEHLNDNPMLFEMLV